MYYLIHVLYSSFEGNEFSLMGVCWTRLPVSQSSIRLPYSW
jgi:hypothetical protein